MRYTNRCLPLPLTLTQAVRQKAQLFYNSLKCHENGLRMGYIFLVIRNFKLIENYEYCL